MVILGIDPGLSATGWGIVSIENKNCIYMTHGTIKSKSSENINARILHIKEIIADIIMIYKPDRVIVEEIFVNIKNPRSALKLGMARGAVLIAVAENYGLQSVEYSATFIKKTLTDNGHADKLEILSNVKKRLYLSETFKLQLDAADALGGAITFCIQNDLIDIV